MSRLSTIISLLLLFAAVTMACCKTNSNVIDQKEYYPYSMKARALNIVKESYHKSRLDHPIVSDDSQNMLSTMVSL